LRENTETKVLVKVNPSESNVFSISQSDITITTHALSLAWNTNMFDSSKYFDNGKIETSCEIATGANRIYDLYFDDQLVAVQKYLKGDATSTVSIEITKNTTIKNLDGTSTEETLESYFTHGAHTLKAQLSLAKNDDSRGNSTDFIFKEVAIKDKDMPLIWIGDL
jgi:hypothetical protein